MFDRIVDFLISVAGWFRPWEVIRAYEEGVILRFGKFHRKAEPGFHWIVPFAIEEVLRDNVVPRTTNLGSQSLTTADGKTVVVGAIITSAIRDVRKALLEVEGVDHVLRDSCFGTLATQVSKTEFALVRTEEFAEELTKVCRRGAWKYGIEIQSVKLSDLSASRVMTHHMVGALVQSNS